jgi:hypothetical protein
VLSHAIQFLSKPIASAPPLTVSSAAASAPLHVAPSGERLIASRVMPSSSVSVEMSQVPWAASYATTGSLARSFVPDGLLATVRPGRSPVRQVAPSFVVTA